MMFCIPKWRVWSLLSEQEELLKLNKKKKSAGELRAEKKSYLHASTSKLATLHLRIRE